MSLSRCLKKMGLSAHEGAILKGAAAEYREEGMQARDAAIMAVTDYIEEALKEREDAIAAILKEAKKRGVLADVEAALATLPKFTAKGMGIEVGEGVDSDAHDAATSPKNDTPQPTDAQIEAGNYTKGHIRLIGLDISVENPEGSTRSGTDANGKAWSVTMRSHYGYIKGTVGKDKDHIDVFVKPGTAEDWNGPVFVIDQTKGNGHFDEHKVMLGFETEAEARAAYLANYTKGWDRIRAITTTTPEAFRAWLKDGDTAESFANADGASSDLPGAISDVAARAKLEWRDLGAKDGLRTHAVFFDGMKYGQVTRFHGDARFSVDGGDSKKSLREAKAEAERLAIERLLRDGYVTRAGNEEWKNSAKTEDDLYAEKVDVEGRLLAATVMEEQRGQDFAPSEMPAIVAMRAEEVDVAISDLRAALLKHLDSFDFSEGRKKQIREALDPTRALNIARDLGAQAARNGDPRDPPEHLSSGEKQVWRGAWDRAKKLKEATPQIPSARELASFIGIAADSVKTLRKDDVERVIREAPTHFRRALAGHIGEERPELAQEAREVLAELNAEKPAAPEPEQSPEAKEEAQGSTAPEPGTVEPELEAEAERVPPEAADSIPPAPIDTPVVDVTTKDKVRAEGQPSKIQDFGEKIGGARKDTAVSTGKRAKKESDDKPAWARKYVVMPKMARIGARSEATEETGPFVIYIQSSAMKGAVKPVDRSEYPTRAAAEAMLPLVEAARNHRVFSIGGFEGAQQTFGIYRLIGERKRALVKGGFLSRDAAMMYLAASPVEIIEHKFQFPEKPWLDHIERVGKSRRDGDVTTAMFQETFGFRGGEFGNWNTGSDGQASLNHAYDALLDLADVLGVPPRALSLNGELSIAFGARGHGGKDSARAHYEPGKFVINLTKIRGAGSLAHEWFHALDDYFGRVDGKGRDANREKVLASGGRPYVTHGFSYKSEARPELIEAFKAVVDTMLRKQEGVAIDAGLAQRRLDDLRKDMDYRLADLRSRLTDGNYNRGKKVATAEQLKAWDAMAEKLRRGEMGALVRVGMSMSPLRMGFASSDVLQEMNALYKSVVGRSFDVADESSAGRRLYWQAMGIQQWEAKAKAAAEGGIETRSLVTDFMSEARKIDGYRASDYWSTVHEMGARAFESYIFDKMATAEQRSDYLVYGVENRYYVLHDMRPYPEGDERVAINKAFDRLFEVIEAKEADGKVALLSRADASKRLRHLAELATTSTNENQAVDLGAVAGWEVAEARDKAGLSLEGYHHTVDLYAVRHTLNQHGDAKKERARGQLPVTEDDIAALPAVVAAPDATVYGAKNNRGQDIIASLKRMADGSLLVVEEVRIGAKVLALASVRKVPAARDFDSVARTLLSNARSDGGALTIAKHARPDESTNLDGPQVDPTLSRSPFARRQRASEQDIAAVVAEVKRRLPGAPNVIVVKDYRDPRIPRSLAKRMAEGNAEGAYHNGTVYLVAPLISDIDYAAGLLAHENFHAALDLLEEEKTALLLDMREGNEQLRKDAATLRAKFPDMGEIESVEEALAEYAREGREPTLMQRFVAFVRRALRAIGLKRIADGWTDGEVLALVADAPKRAFGKARGDAVRLYTEGRLSRAGQAIKQAVGIEEKPIPEWVSSQSPETQEALRKAGVWHQGTTLKDRVQSWRADWKKRLRQGIFDQFDPIKEYDERAYMLARMTKGSDAALEALLNYGTLKLDGDGAVEVDFAKGGFLGVLSKLENEHDRFMAWVVGHRAERLMAEGKEHNFTADDISRLKALNRGALPSGKNREIAYTKAASELDAFNRSVLDLAEQSGLIDKESRTTWEKGFYVPFYRVMEDEATRGPVNYSGLVNQYAFKKLKGGAQALGDPLENSLRNWSHLISASLKNQAARESLLAAERMGAAMEAPEGAAKDMAKSMGDGGMVVPFLDQGRQRWYVVDDPFLLDALKSIGFSGFTGPAMQIMGKFKRLLTLGVTVSPTFRIRNVIRDSLSMIGANPASYNVLSNVLTGWQGTDEKSADFAGILAAGGVMRYGTHLEGDRAEYVKRLIKAGVEDKTVLDNEHKVKAAFMRFVDWWQKTGDRAENINRVALYKTLREQGVSHLEAAYRARDVMDFSMQGTWGAIRILTQVVPFMNARLQGLYKLGRGAQEDPRRFATVLGAVSIASIALLLAYQDDDDWKAREDWDRDTFWWFKIGDTAFRIPKPFEIGAMATVFERGLEVMVTDELTGQEFAARMWSLVMQNLSMNPTPQLFVPLLELWANKSFFTDRPIEAAGMEGLSTSERAGPNTSGVAQVIGKAGVLSPVQIDHLVSAYLGWLGTHAVMAADFAVRPALGLPERADRRTEEWFVVGDFARELPDRQSRYVTRLYEQGKKFGEALADLKHFQQTGQQERAEALMKERAADVQKGAIYQHATRSLGAFNREINRIQQDQKMSSEDKRKALDAMYQRRAQFAREIERASRAIAR